MTTNMSDHCPDNEGGATLGKAVCVCARARARACMYVYTYVYAARNNRRL